MRDKNLNLDLSQFNFKPLNILKSENENKTCDKEESETESNDFSNESEDDLEIMALNIEIPNNYEEALLSPNRENWKKAMQEELDTIVKRDVWDIVPRNDVKKMKIITCRWVFALKTNQDGSIKRFKARLVAHGHKQKYGVDYDLTFSPVTDFEIIKMFFTLLVILNGWQNRHLDVKCAYLYGSLTEDIFMEFPEGYGDNDKNFVLKLKKALYGLKQSGRSWYEHLSETLKTLNFVQSQYNPCIFYLSDNCVILLYVDDLIVFAKNDVILKRIYDSLISYYDVCNLGDISKVLGVQFESCNGEIFMHQINYIDKLLKMYNIDLTVKVFTPLDVGLNFSNSELDESCDDLPFRELLGSLLFLANRTRPDILFPVIFAAQFSAKPNIDHYNLLIRILKYVGHTRNYAINLSKANSAELVIYSDASWASSVDCRRSISGYIWSLGGVYLGWRSATQKCIAKSTMEAEFVALDMAVTEANYLANIMNEFKHSNFSNTVPKVLCDNQAAISFSDNVIVNNRTKHIDIRYYYVRDLHKKNFDCYSICVL